LGGSLVICRIFKDMITCTNCDEVIEDAARGTTACQIINRTPRIQNMSCEIEMLVEKLLAAERAVTLFTPADYGPWNRRVSHTYSVRSYYGVWKRLQLYDQSYAVMTSRRILCPSRGDH
jgi:hypothetical protein